MLITVVDVSEQTAMAPKMELLNLEILPNPLRIFCFATKVMGIYQMSHTWTILIII